MNLIVTGRVQSGKTTWCAEYSRWLVAQNFTVGGVLCPEVRNNGIRIGYDLIDVRTKRTVTFGRLASDAGFPGEPVGDYRISYRGLEFARRAIRAALDSSCDMVIIDEVGHLELAGKGIIESALTACRQAANTTIVVRKALLAAFLESFQLTNPRLIFNIKDLERDIAYPLPGKNY